MAPSEHLQTIAIAGTTGKNEISSVSRQPRFDEGTAKKTTYFQLYLAFVLSFFWFWAGGLRTEQIGHDFPLYVDQVTKYYSPSDVRFPDLVFHSIATVLTMVVDTFGFDKALAVRVFFLTVAFLQAILLFIILRSKRPAEMFLIAIGFCPLIFLDIIRQGLAMLLAGAFFVDRGRKKAGLLLLAAATHVSSIVSIGAFDPRQEGSILILLYILGVALPLFFRTYLFYLFVVTCSRDVFVRKWSVGSVLFNIGYAILVLRMAPL